MIKLSIFLNKRKGIQYLLSYLIPLGILIGVFVASGIAPYGDKTLLYSDAYAQFIDYCSYIHRILHGQESFFYSFSKDIGGNVFGALGGFPFNIFLYLFYFGELETFPVLYSFICILNTAACGLTMFVFLCCIYGRKSSHLLFSTIYSLCGYCTAFNYHIFWLTSVMMLPLIALGIIKLVKGKSAIFYFIVLTYSLLENFYLGYMLCIFSVLYFFMLYFINLRAETATYGNRRVIVARYFISSLLSGLCAAWIWLPICLSFVDGRLQQVTYEHFEFVENMPITDIAAKLFSGASSVSEQINGRPNIFCTLFVVALVILYFLDDRNSIKKKAGYAAILTVYILSFYIKTFSSVFNMFSKANWFNFRASFVFSFLLIQVAVEEFGELQDIHFPVIKKCLLVMLAATVIVFSKQYEFVSGGMVLVDWVILLAIFGGLVFYRKYPSRADYQTLVMLFGICISLNLYINYYFSVKSISDWEKPLSEYTDKILSSAVLTEAIQTADEDFYRMDNENQITGNCGNDPVLLGYNGVGQFTSTERSFVLKNLSRFGVNWYDMRTSYDSGVPASMDSFLGLKYIISEDDLSENKHYIRKLKFNDDTCFENGNVLPIAMLSEGNMEGINIEEGNIFELQNTIWKSLTAENENLFEPVTDINYRMHDISTPKEYNCDGNRDDEIWNEDTVSSTSGTTAEEAELPGDYYIEYNFVAKKEEPIYLYTGAFIDPKSGSTADVLQYLGTYKTGENVNGTIKVPSSLTTEVFEYTCNHNSVYYENLDLLSKYSAIVKTKDIEVAKDGGRKLSGRFSTDASQTLLLTIPYDEGWTLFIDGKEVDYEKCLDLFMSCKADPGEHTWSMVYLPKYFKSSCYLSLGALLAAGCFFIIDRRKKESLQLKTVPDIVAK